MRISSLVQLLCLLFTFFVHGQQFSVKEKDGTFVPAILGKDGETLLESPNEGLWSIATGWRNKWMTDWHSVNPTTKEVYNGQTILSGKIVIPEGEMLIRDAYNEEDGRIKCIRRFTWLGNDTLRKTTLTIRFFAPGKGKKVCMPGILYYGNPSGEESGRTAFYKGLTGEMAYFEEHRFPMPFTSLEWNDGSTNGVALHSVPSPVPFANRNDQWWSLGVEARENGTLLSLLSGACGANGKGSVIKTHQGKVRSMFSDYDEAYVNIPPKATIEKIFYLQAYPVEREGAGFQTPVHTAIDIHEPSMEGMPSFESIIRNKYSMAQARWLEASDYAGFNQFDNNLGNNLEYIVLGWVGQAAAPGYAFQKLQDVIDDPESLKMSQKSLDFIASAGFYEDGIYTWYDVKKGKWGPRIWKENPELLSQGQCMLNMANAIKASATSMLNPEQWIIFLKKASDFHSKRILTKGWNPKSTDEAFFIAPLAKAAMLFDNETYRKAALKAGEHYANRHLNMGEVYWGGTLDASCEDKEGAFGALQGFLALYELTRHPKYLKWAEHAGDVTLSYTYLWDVDLPSGRLRDHNFKTRGWTAVSVQNMHIDVYGVLIAPYLYQLGVFNQDEDVKELAKTMFISCGQLIDPYGSQGEQPQQTNYTQRPNADADWTRYRGDYVEDWTVFWITAHFLNGAALFKELDAVFDEE